MTFDGEDRDDHAQDGTGRTNSKTAQQIQVAKRVKEIKALTASQGRAF